MRGYNESEAPVGIEHYQAHLVAKDIVELIQYLGWKYNISIKTFQLNPELFLIMGITYRESLGFIWWYAL